MPLAASKDCADLRNVDNTRLVHTLPDVQAMSLRTLPRRRFLATLGVAAPLLSAPLRCLATTPAPRELTFAHLHTGERLRVEYFSGGAYLPDALGEVNRLLRDFRSGDIGVIDPALLDFLHRLAAATDTGKPFEIISGYRSPATNRKLQQAGRGVATRSRHMSGQAIDIRLADVPLAGLRDAALAARRGGVGFYPASRFVHVDTGPVRAW